MAYTTYEFYTITYYGETIAESAFPKWLSRATDELNYLTFNSITEEKQADFETQISKATCALMDVMYQIDFATINATSAENGNVKSLSSGNESISFGNNDTLITTVLADRKAQLQLERSAVLKYLADTGLLYGGMQ